MRIVKVVSLVAVLMLLAGLSNAGARPERQAGRLVLAFYYGWFDDNTWSFDQVPDMPVQLYRSRDRSTIERHVAQAQQAGIDAFRPGKYDVVITDLGMPEVDGRRVAMSVKKQSPDTPVILLTGWGAGMGEEAGVREWIDCALGKPFTTAQLEGALAQLVGPETEGEDS